MRVHSATVFDWLCTIKCFSVIQIDTIDWYISIYVSDYIFVLLHDGVSDLDYDWLAVFRRFGFDFSIYPGHEVK